MSSSPPGCGWGLGLTVDRPVRRRRVRPARVSATARTRCRIAAGTLPRPWASPPAVCQRTVLSTIAVVMRAGSTGRDRGAAPRCGRARRSTSAPCRPFCPSIPPWARRACRGCRGESRKPIGLREARREAGVGPTVSTGRTLPIGVGAPALLEDRQDDREGTTPPRSSTGFKHCSSPARCPPNP
jgi:hypothetical protein